MELQLIKLLSSYSVDCVLVAILDCFFVMLFKRKTYSLPTKLNRVLPFLFALTVYLAFALATGRAMDWAIRCAATAGGLATVIYAFMGGYSLTDEEELSLLLKSLLKNLIADEKIAQVSGEILSGLKEEGDKELTIIRISHLIKANISRDADEDEINSVSKIFVNAYNLFKLNSKK